MNSENFRNYSQGAKYIAEGILCFACIGAMIYIAKHGNEIVETLGFMMAQAITIQI